MCEYIPLILYCWCVLYKQYLCLYTQQVQAVSVYIPLSSGQELALNLAFQFPDINSSL